MNVHVILRWDWTAESTVDSEFAVLGVFSDLETAQFQLDELQREALLKGVTTSFYWIETHEVDKILVGDR